MQQSRSNDSDCTEKRLYRLRSGHDVFTGLNRASHGMIFTFCRLHVGLVPQPVSDDSDGDSGADTGPHGAATASVTTKSHSDSGASEETSNNAGRGSYNAPSGGFNSSQL